MNIINRTRFRNFVKLNRFIRSKVWNIRYVIYNILSKYNIIYYKHSYLDYIPNGEVVLPKTSVVETEHYKFILECKCINNTRIDEEYFYHKTKHGNKIVFKVRDEFNDVSRLFFYPVEIYLKFQSDSKWIKVNDRPLSVTTYTEPVYKNIGGKKLRGDSIIRADLKETILDTSPLWDIRFNMDFNSKLEDITEDDIKLCEFKLDSGIKELMKDIPIGSLIRSK